MALLKFTKEVTYVPEEIQLTLDRAELAILTKVVGITHGNSSEVSALWAALYREARDLSEVGLVMRKDARGRIGIWKKEGK